MRFSNSHPLLNKSHNAIKKQKSAKNTHDIYYMIRNKKSKQYLSGR
ncbi:hypothetical protein CLOSTHATH_04540 [Hungatella hathewayi DSM 13479]|uniref:Uncharacterized protein n=1 Tax=Hungatella hathewayi DSM 13479 TaxID=566550 RepID=D3ALP4_9FIRM|nr:hypothetical protein CLOSTHATH_04540 [Hungatella hathewayi DSM 13479]